MSERNTAQQTEHKKETKVQRRLAKAQREEEKLEARLAKKQAQLQELVDKGKEKSAEFVDKMVYTPDEMRVIEKQEEERFAKGLNFYKLFWIFFIGAFLGVLLETVSVFITSGTLMSRVGLVYGPFNLVYGFGCLFMTLGLYWLRKSRDAYVFVVGMVIGGAFEYFCSWIQEKMFGTVSWDYSEMAFNLNGRINLLYTFFWGILAVLWVKVIFPRLEIWILKIPNVLGKTLTWVLFAFMVVNTVVSCLAVICWVKNDAGLPPKNTVETYMYEHYTPERMRRIYPSMQISEASLDSSWLSALK